MAASTCSRLTTIEPSSTDETSGHMAGSTVPEPIRPRSLIADDLDRAGRPASAAASGAAPSTSAA